MNRENRVGWARPGPRPKDREIRGPVIRCAALPASSSRLRQKTGGSEITGSEPTSKVDARQVFVVGLLRHRWHTDSWSNDRPRFHDSSQVHALSGAVLGSR